MYATYDAGFLHGRPTNPTKQQLVSADEAETDQASQRFFFFAKLMASHQGMQMDLLGTWECIPLQNVAPYNSITGVRLAQIFWSHASDAKLDSDEYHNP